MESVRLAPAPAEKKGVLNIHITNYDGIRNERQKKKEQQLSVPSTFVITGRNSCFLSLNVKKKDGTTETRRDP